MLYWMGRAIVMLSLILLIFSAAVCGMYILYVALKVLSEFLIKWRRERLDRNERFEAIRQSYLNATPHVFEDLPHGFSETENRVGRNP